MLSVKVGNYIDPPPAYYGGGETEEVGGYILSNLFWNRLECRPRNVNFDEVIRAEIRDPLFMLTRQWQFGEFNAEDTGSSVQSKLEVQTTKLTRYKSFNGEVQPYNDSLPLEVQVERQPIEFDYHERVSIGKFLNKQLKENLSASDYNTVITELLSEYTFEVPAVDTATMSDYELVNHAKDLSNQKYIQYLNLVSGRLIDGLKFYESLNTAVASNINDTSALNSFITSINNLPSGITNSLNTSFTVFYNWFNKLYSIPDFNKNENAWDESRLEYRFDISTAKFNNSGTRVPNAIYSAEEYYSDKLDWHSFVAKDIEETNPLNQITNLSEYSGESVTTYLGTVLPAIARFPGMPANRYWQFEDGSFNFGKIETNTADIAKILFTEFALVYQDDFMVVPFDVPVGSISKVTGIVVTDVFGVKTYVKHVIDSENNSFSAWEKWNMYNMTAENNEQGRKPNDTKIFIPPTLTYPLEGEVLEKIVFIRDEMSNLVWAIEKNVSDKLGGTIEGDQSSRSLIDFLKNLKPSIEPVSNEDIKLQKFKLGNSVAENWIPFTPVQLPNGNRKNVLQRASMPLILENYTPIPLRPRSVLLRKGIDEDDSLIKLNNADPRYFIAEEEITRSGVEVSSSIQLARWFNGKTYLWRGNKKRNGRGEGNSGLEFDRVIE